jgi:hypothetical protein
MSNNPFANSKSALIFAGTTIAGALMFAGSQKGIGDHDLPSESQTEQHAQSVEEAPSVSEKRSQVIEPLDPAAGWGGTPEPVFGDYSAEEEDPAEAVDEQPRPTRTQSSPRQPIAPRGSIGGTVKADNPGILVPRPGDMGEGANAYADPDMPSQTLSIEL